MASSASHAIFAVAELFVLQLWSLLVAVGSRVVRQHERPDVRRVHVALWDRGAVRSVRGIVHWLPPDNVNLASQLHPSSFHRCLLVQLRSGIARYWFTSQRVVTICHVYPLSGGTIGRASDMRFTCRGFECWLGIIAQWPWALSPSSIIWYRPNVMTSLAEKVNVGLVESNRSPPPGLWRYDEVTCRLTATKPGSALCPTPVIEYGTTYLLTFMRLFVCVFETELSTFLMFAHCHPYHRLLTGY